MINQSVAFEQSTAFPQSGRSVHQTQLLEKIERKTAKIGIIGLGYVGLPLAVTKAKMGYPVTGFDVNPGKIEQVNRGLNYIDDVDNDEMADLVAEGRLRATNHFDLLADMDVIIICVPTPLTRNRTPDIAFIESASQNIAKTLRPGQLIVLESTTYPGSTDDIVLPMLSQSGLHVGQDFFLAYSPERVDPGNTAFQTQNTTKVVGGTTPHCLEVAKAMYEHSISRVVPVSSTKAAEMVKVFENTFRAVNIGLVNELALVCDKLGLNVWEVIDAAASKPFGFMKFTPGPGIGGHCIPVDPFYLTWKVKEFNIPTRFIELAGEINSTMPQYVRELVLRALGEHYKPLNGSKVLVLGVAYKPNIGDWRESPAQHVLDILSHDGAQVTYHDPFVPGFVDHTGRGYSNVELTDDVIRDADCVLILTDHSDIDYENVVQLAKVVVDTRNATKNVIHHREKIRLL